MDHFLSVFNVLARHPHRRCIVIGPEDIALLLPPQIDLQLAEGCTVSLFPLAPVRVQGTGLQWPVDDVDFEPQKRSGTSNRATGPVTLKTADPAMLLLLPRDCLELTLQALNTAPLWPAPAP